MLSRNPSFYPSTTATFLLSSIAIQATSTLLPQQYHLEHSPRTQDPNIKTRLARPPYLLTSLSMARSKELVTFTLLALGLTGKGTVSATVSSSSVSVTSTSATAVAISTTLSSFPTAVTSLFSSGHVVPWNTSAVASDTTASVAGNGTAITLYMPNTTAVLPASIVTGPDAASAISAYLSALEQSGSTKPEYTTTSGRSGAGSVPYASALSTHYTSLAHATPSAGYPMTACTEGGRLVNCGREQLGFGAAQQSVNTQVPQYPGKRGAESPTVNAERQACNSGGIWHDCGPTPTPPPTATTSWISYNPTATSVYSSLHCEPTNGGGSGAWKDDVMSAIQTYCGSLGVDGVTLWDPRVDLENNTLIHADKLKNGVNYQLYAQFSPYDNMVIDFDYDNCFAGFFYPIEHCNPLADGTYAGGHVSVNIPDSNGSFLFFETLLDFPLEPGKRSAGSAINAEHPTPTSFTKPSFQAVGTGNDHPNPNAAELSNPVGTSAATEFALRQTVGDLYCVNNGSYAASEDVWDSVLGFCSIWGLHTFEEDETVWNTFPTATKPVWLKYVYTGAYGWQMGNGGCEAGFSYILDNCNVNNGGSEGGNYWPNLGSQVWMMAIDPDMNGQPVNGTLEEKRSVGSRETVTEMVDVSSPQLEASTSSLESRTPKTCYAQVDGSDYCCGRGTYQASIGEIEQATSEFCDSVSQHAYLDGDDDFSLWYPVTGGFAHFAIDVSSGTSLSTEVDACIGVFTNITTNCTPSGANEGQTIGSFYVQEDAFFLIDLSPVKPANATAGVKKRSIPSATPAPVIDSLASTLVTAIQATPVIPRATSPSAFDKRQENGCQNPGNGNWLCCPPGATFRAPTAEIEQTASDFCDAASQQHTYLYVGDTFAVVYAISKGFARFAIDVLTAPPLSTEGDGCLPLFATIYNFCGPNGANETQTLGGSAIQVNALFTIVISATNAGGPVSSHTQLSLPSATPAVVAASAASTSVTASAASTLVTAVQATTSSLPRVFITEEHDTAAEGKLAARPATRSNGNFQCDKSGPSAALSDIRTNVHSFCSNKNGVEVYQGYSQTNSDLPIPGGLQVSIGTHRPRNTDCATSVVIEDGACRWAFAHLLNGCTTGSGNVYGGSYVSPTGCETWSIDIAQASESKRDALPAPEIHAAAADASELGDRTKAASLQRRDVSCGSGQLASSTDLEAAVQTFCKKYSSQVLVPGNTQTDNIPLSQGGEATLLRTYRCSGFETIAYNECVVTFDDIITACQADGNAAESYGGSSVDDSDCTSYQLKTPNPKNNGLMVRQGANVSSCLQGTPVSSVALQEATDFFCTWWNGFVIHPNNTLYQNFQLHPPLNVPSAKANITIVNECDNDMSVVNSTCKASFDNIVDDCDNGNTESAGGSYLDETHGRAKYSLTVEVGI